MCRSLEEEEWNERDRGRGLMPEEGRGEARSYNTQAGQTQEAWWKVAKGEQANKQPQKPRQGALGKRGTSSHGQRGRWWSGRAWA